MFLCGNPKMIGVPVKNKDDRRREYPQPPGVIEILEKRGFQADNAGGEVQGQHPLRGVLVSPAAARRIR